MSQQEHHAQVQQWQQEEEEQARSDEEFRKALEEKFPELKAWPQKEPK